MTTPTVGWQTAGHSASDIIFSEADAQSAALISVTQRLFNDHPIYPLTITSLKQATANTRLAVSNR